MYQDDSAPETYEAMGEAAQEDWHRVRGRMAGERVRIRTELAEKFQGFSLTEKHEELNRVQEALESLDSNLIGDSTEEDPFDREHRIKLEESLKLLL